MSLTYDFIPFHTFAKDTWILVLISWIPASKNFEIELYYSVLLDSSLFFETEKNEMDLWNYMPCIWFHEKILEIDLQIQIALYLIHKKMCKIESRKLLSLNLFSHKIMFASEITTIVVQSRLVDPAVDPFLRFWGLNLAKKV